MQKKEVLTKNIERHQIIVKLLKGGHERQSQSRALLPAVVFRHLCPQHMVNCESQSQGPFS